MKHFNFSFKSRWLLLPLLLLTISVGNVWATDPTVTSTFTNDSWGVGSGEPAWTASSITVTAKVDKGVQVTLSNIKNAGGFTLTNNTFKNTTGLDKITGISLNVSSNGTGGSISGVTVGGTTFKNGTNNDYSVSKSDGQTPSFTHSTGAKGDIVISFASTATSKSLYIKSITITYTVAASCSNTPSMSFTPNSVEKTVGDANFTKTVSITGKGAGQTVAYSSSNTSVATVNSSTGEVTIKTNGSTTITASVAESGDYCSASASYTLTVNKPTHKVYFYNGSTLLNTGGTSVEEGASVTYSGSTPVSCDDGDGASSTFVGWATNTWTNKKSAKGDIPAGTTFYDVTASESLPNMSTDDVTYHAVFAKGTEVSTPVANTWTRITSTSQLTDGATVLLVQYYYDRGLKTDLSQSSVTANSEITNSTAALRWTIVKSGSKWKFKNSSNQFLSTASLDNNTTLSLNSTYDEWTITADDGGGSGSDYTYTNTNCFKLNNGSDLECMYKSYTYTFKLYAWSIKYSACYPFYIYIQKTTSSTTYSNYMTTCCTPLGQINGSFNVTSKSESARSFSWTKETTESDVDHYELSYKVKGAQGDATSIANNISNSTSTYTHTANLTAGETYVYYLKAVGANNHCDATEELEVVIPQITVTGTPIAEMTYAQEDGPSSAESFVVKGKGLTDNLSVEAPANFEVCLTNSATASDWKTSGTAITITKANAESNSGQTVYVRLKAGLLNANSPFGPSNVVVSGGSATSVNVSVSGTVSSSCTAPVVATPTLTSIANGTITVSCASITVDENCDVDDYGFVWKANSEPTISDHKNAIEGDYAANFSKTLTIDGFATGTTYNIKAYGHNSADNGLSSTLAITPQSVTFRVNSVAVSTVYVNNGSKVADPGDPSQTGWDFQEWQSGGVAYDFDAAVTEDLVLDAFFTIQSFNLTWTTDGDALTGDYTGKSGKVNYGTTIVAPNTPTKTGYTFAAWSPAVAATMPDHDLSYTATWTAKQYAITLDREGATTGSESVTMTYNANTHSAITAPSKDGYIFGGWYAEDNGTGAQVMNASGTLQANVEGFTGANGIWTKDATCTLYAKWTPITFTVAFNANGGSGETMSNQDYTYDVPQTLSANTYTAPLHKYFYGWHSVKASADAGTREFTDGQTNVQNLTTTNGATVTLYAVWKDHTYTNYRTLCCNPLAAPANIAVSVTGAATATVTWDAVADATGYEYKLGNGDWTDTEIAGNAASPELSLTGLTGASDYTIYVRTNGNGDNCAEGTPSAGTNFRTYSTVTAAENDPLMGTAKVSLNNSDWYDAVEAADETTIYLQATPGSLYQFSNWATPASGTISSNQLTGWSGDVTVTANFVAKELTKLDTPTGMGLVGEPTATSATIKWNAVDHASGYEVVCAGATKGDITVTDGVASCPLTILTAGTTYYWTVKAKGDGISFEDGDACASQNFTTDLRKPTAIEITHEPTLTEYLEGQSFATAGMVVKVTYNNGDIDGAYTGYSIDPSGALTFGTTSVTVTASLNEVSVSTTQAITVHKKYTLTFKNNGSIIETRDLKEGDAYGAFPDEGEACDATSTTFMGWSTVAEFSDKREAAPAEGYASEDDVMGTENVILNAVWAKVSGNDGADVNTVMWAENWNNATISNGSSGQSSANPDDNCSTSKGTIIYNSAAISYTQSSSDYVYCRNDNSYAGGTVPELYIKSGYSWTISGIPTGNAATLTLTFKANTASFQTLTVSTTEVGKNPTISGSITEKVGTYTITTDGASTLQITFGNNSNTRIDDVVLKVATKNISYTDYLTTCCNEWSVTASYGESNTINVGDDALAVTLSDVAYGAASYESSDEAVLTVAADGKITGVKAGSATVTIAWAGISGSKCAYETTVDVTVNGPITVTYNANDGSQDPETTSQNATSNSAFTLDANTFSRTGYTFQGWATTPSGDKVYNDSQADVEFAEDVTLYAVWSINSHAVTLTQPTGNTITANSSTTPGNVNYGTTVTLTATENETASDGYVFTGWTVDGATVVDASAKETTFTMPDNAVSVSATYTHYTWDLTGYTVTTAPKIEYYKVEKFSTAGVVIKENYKRSDNDDTKQETYAGAWTAKLDGTPIANGADLSLEDDGKTLKLYIGEDEIASYTLTVNNIDVDQFVVGIWDIEAPSFQINTYTMPTLSNQTAGDAATCKDHNIFIGWTTDPDDPKDANITAGGTEGIVASNTTYYAVWAKMGNVTKTLSYGWEDGESSTGLNITMTTSSTEGGARTGSKFATAANGQIVKTSSSYASPKSITYYVKKQTKNKNENNYFVLQYSANGSSWTDIDATKRTLEDLSQTEWTEISLDLSAETYQNKYFQVRFNTGGAPGSLDDYSFSYQTTGPTDYIVDCEARYEIQFDANGATGSYDPIKKAADKTIELPSGSLLSKEYHNFAGWKIGATPYEAGDTYTVSGADAVENIITVTAQWDPFSQGAVTVDGEALEGSPFYATQSYTLPTPEAISGKKFIGWSDGETIVAPGEYTMPDPATNITYTSQWFDLLPTPSSVSFTDGEWILVTAQDQLHAGDFIVVAAANADYAMGAEASGGNNRTVQAVTKSGNTLSYESDVQPLFLQNGYGANQYALYDMSADKYLYAAASNNNYLRIAEDFDQNGSWLITIANGSTSVMAQGANTHNDLRYNAGGSIINSVFSCYAEGGQQPIALYRWIETIKTEGNVNASDVVPTYNVNLVVQTNTSIDMNVERTVNDFYIEAMEGESGQITHPENLNINGNAYYDLTLNTSGTMDNSKWYAFAVPFQVDAATGIQRLSNKGVASNAGFNSHYVLLKYNSAAYASDGQGWEYVTRGETLMPGKFYMIALNSNEYNRVRMTKKAGTPLNNKANLTLSTVGTGIHANWNALANNALAYANVSATGGNSGLKVQVYNSAEDSYTAYEYGKVTFTVGTPFFIQVAEAGTMNVDIAATYNETVKAPARYTATTEEFKLRLGADTESFYDQLYVSASEEAMNEYQIGHDLAKAGVSTTVPQMYVPAYGAKLCDAEFPLVNNEASFPLTFSAPNAGTYQLYVAKAAKDAELYLTLDGNIIWNLSMSPYEVELPKGITEGYGLLLQAKAPSVATGVESAEANEAGVQKVIIEDKVFILRGGQMYDVTGKAVR